MNLFKGKIIDKLAFLSQEETHHCIKVLRNNIKDTIIVTNGKGVVVKGVIASISKKEVQVKDLTPINLPSISTRLHIAIAPTKNLNRFEFFIEKAIELGISEITPILTFHSERKKINLEKLQKKADIACKQCLRSNWVQINPLISIDHFIKNNYNSVLHLAHCNTEFSRIPIKNITFNINPIILIGPEGDFSNQEIKQFSNLHNVTPISLGNNRLRTETAGILSASVVYYNI